MNASALRQRETKRFIRERGLSMAEHFPYVIEVEEARLIADEGSAMNGRLAVSEWCGEQFGPRSPCGQDSYGDEDRWSSFYAAFFFHRETDATAFKIRWG